MKKLLILFVLAISTQAFAYLPKINNWKDNFKLSEKAAAELIYDYYIHYVWWEDEGYECGGDFSEAYLLEAKNDVYTVEGYVTVVQNYCAYESNGYYKVNLKKVDGKYKVEELVFDEGIYLK